MRALAVVAIAALLLLPLDAFAGACSTCTQSSDCGNGVCVQHLSNLGCGVNARICCPGQACALYPDGGASCATNGSCTIVGAGGGMAAGGSAGGGSAAGGSAAGDSAAGGSAAGGSAAGGAGGGTAGASGGSAATAGGTAGGGAMMAPGCSCAGGATGPMLVGLLLMLRAARRRASSLRSSHH